jgi:hypothetical protein
VTPGLQSQPLSQTFCIILLSTYCPESRTNRADEFPEQPPQASPQGRGPGRDDAFARECGRGCPSISSIVETKTKKFESIRANRIDWQMSTLEKHSSDKREKNLTSPFVQARFDVFDLGNFHCFLHLEHCSSIEVQLWHAAH